MTDIDNETLSEVKALCMLIMGFPYKDLDAATYKRAESLAFSIAHHPNILNAD